METIINLEIIIKSIEFIYLYSNINIVRRYTITMIAKSPEQRWGAPLPDRYTRLQVKAPTCRHCPSNVFNYTDTTTSNTQSILYTWNNHTIFFSAPAPAHTVESTLANGHFSSSNFTIKKTTMQTVARRAAYTHTTSSDKVSVTVTESCKIIFNKDVWLVQFPHCQGRIC